ncbi:hypothetical protein TNCV_4246831 [Trichonephila clavipes]|nr:hypothetical protein TNCV_4246831 [Trichonephila clavipes]
MYPYGYILPPKLDPQLDVSITLGENAHPPEFSLNLLHCFKKGQAATTVQFLGYQLRRQAVDLGRGVYLTHRPTGLQLRRLRCLRRMP